MSAEPRSYPTYAPDPPSRFRWVPPLCLGVALGGLIGCVATFVILALGKQAQSNELAAEQFNIQNVLNAIPGTGDVRAVEDTNHLGRMDSRQQLGSAVRRRFRLQGSLEKGTDPNIFGQQLKPQINAELDRQGVYSTSGGSSSSTGRDEYRQTQETSYQTRDGRRGQLDLHLVIRDGRVEGILILTEGR